MTDPLRPATMADLQAILDDVEKHPAKKQKLATAPADALRKAGLVATPNAIEFIRSLGETKFDPEVQVEKPSENDPVKTGMAEG